jgi:hypothetical protein
MVSVGLTIKRAVLQALWAGSFLLSSVFAHFLGNAKSMKKQMQCQNSKNGFFFKITDSKIITSTLIKNITNFL